jgi:hypothetical protein
VCCLMALMFLFGSTRQSEEVQRRYDNAYVQCMYAKGNQIPAVASPVARRALSVAPPPPPPLPALPH